MLTRIILENFKPIRHLDLKPSPMTVFIGPNDSGKSSILQAVHLASKIASKKPLTDVLGGAQRLENFRKKTDSGPIRFQFEWRPSFVETCHWSFELGETKEDGAFIRKETWGSDDEKVDESKQRDKSDLPSKLAGFFGSAKFCHMVPDRLKQPSYSDEDTPRLAFDGGGLPSVLAAMQGLSRVRFDELEERFVEMVPTVKQILIGPGPVVRNETETIRIDDEAVAVTRRRRYTGHRLLFDTVSGNRVPASHMSDGSILILGCLTALMSREGPNLFLLEEPENGIHPKALGPLVSFFRDCLKKEGTQIMMTSHSPYLVDFLEPREIFLILREFDFMTATRLDKLPDIERWIEKTDFGTL